MVDPEAVERIVGKGQDDLTLVSLAEADDGQRSGVSGSLTVTLVVMCAMIAARKRVFGSATGPRKNSRHRRQ